MPSGKPEGRKVTALPWRMSPTFSFCTCQKENVPGTVQEEKRFCPNLHTVQVWGNGFCENCCAGEELRTKSRAECGFYPTLYAMLTVTSILGLQRGHPLLLFPLPLPLSSEGFPKGRAAARPFVSFQGGAGGNRNPPAFLFRGPGGILFSKENIPLASPYRNGTFCRESR